MYVIGIYPSQIPDTVMVTWHFLPFLAFFVQKEKLHRIACVPHFDPESY